MEYYKNIDELLNSKNIKRLNIKKHQIKFLEELILNFDKKIISNKYDMLKVLINCDVKDKNWVDCFNDSFKYKNGNASIESLIARYGDTVGNNLYNERKQKYGVTKEKYIKKYGKIKGEKKWKELCESKKSISKNIMIERYGEIEGNKRWDMYLKKWKKSIQIKKESGTWNANSTLKRYIEKYGEILGKEKWDEKISYWKYQNSLKGYINKYGKDDGEKKWEERCKKMDFGSLNYFQKKYGKDIGFIKYKERTEKVTTYLRTAKTYSKISQELFWNIYNKLNDKSNIKFAELNEEQIFFVNKFWSKVFYVDFKKGNKIIEFDGDYWHSSEKQKNIDKKRTNFLKSKGYDILRIKEKKYKKNKEKILNECLKFLGENINAGT